MQKTCFWCQYGWATAMLGSTSMQITSQENSKVAFAYSTQPHRRCYVDYDAVPTQCHKAFQVELMYRAAEDKGRKTQIRMPSCIGQVQQS